LAGYPELGLMAAQLAKDWSEALVASHGASVTLPCDGGGTLSLQLVGKDSSGAPSPGDQVSATLNQCYVRVLDDVFDGTASVDLSAPATGAQWAGVWHFGSHFVTLGSIPIQVEGDVAFETRSDSLSYTVHAFSGVRSLVVSASSGTQVKLADTVTQLDVRKVVARDTAKIVSSWKLRLASEVLGGSVQVDTTVPLSGWFDQAPGVGRIEATGANGAVAALQASSNAEGFVASLGSATKPLGAEDFATGYLWWTAGITPPGPGNRGYLLKSDSPNSFALLQQPTATSIRQKAVLAWQFSRPLAQGSTPLTATFRRTALRGSGYDWSGYEIPADVNVQGAYVTVTPHTGLQPGVSYQLLWSNTMPTDSKGSAVLLDSPVLAVLDSISANAGTTGQLLYGKAASLTLDGRASRSADGSALASAQWRQVSGPALQLTNANTLTPMVALATGTNGSGVAELELEVRNAQGEFDRDRITINVVNDAQPFQLIALQAPGRQPVYRLVSGDALSTDYSRVFLLDSGQQVLDIYGQTSRLLAGQSVAWGLGQSQVVDGSHANASVTDPSLPAGCDARGATWTVSEWQAAPFVQGRTDVGRLAWDMNLNCPGLGVVKVAVRVNSAKPLDW